MRHWETAFDRWMYDNPYKVVGILISLIVGACVLAVILAYWEKSHCQRHDTNYEGHAMPDTAEYYRTMRDGAVNPSTMDRYNEYYMAEELRAIRMELQTLNSNIINLK